ncbi:MAG: peptide-binding protein [Nitrospiraceae bacterium]|nr:peptide-binding protein [Nitrospiraceae bacterium]
MFFPFNIRKNRRYLAGFFLLLITASFLAACHKAPEGMPDTVVVGSLADARRLLPLFAGDSASADISGLIFNGLTKYDKNVKITGDLAKSWEIKKGGLEIIFHLRKGVKWQDGKDFTSADVLFTYKTVTDPKVPTPYSSNYGPVDKVEAPDPYTVKVYYKKPFAPALESWGMGIIPKHILEGKDVSAEQFNRHPIGTGPYRLKQWITGQRIELEAFDGYFEGKPGIKRYIMRIIPDMSTMFLELKFGGIDYMDVSPAQYKLVVSRSAFFRKFFNRFQYPSFGFTYVGWNLLDPRFSDVRIRRALSHAIDKASIIKGALMGYGTPCTGPFLPGSWAYNPDVPDPSYDPARSLELFREAGWTLKKGVLQKDGKPFRFTILTNQGNTERLLAAEIIKEDLRKAGVIANIKVLEWQALLHDFIDKKRFEAVILGWSLSRDPDLYEIFDSSQTKDGGFNFVSFKDQEADRLIEEGRTTFDLKKRKQIYHKLHYLLAQEQPYTFLYVPDALEVLNKKFHGVREAPLGIWYNFIHWWVPRQKTMWYN